MTMNRRWFPIMSIMVLLVFMIASCGRADTGTTDDADDDTGTADDGADTADAEVSPDIQDELRIAVTRLGNEGLDPIQSVTDSMNYLLLMFDPLVGVDHGADDIANNGVAEGWEVSDDGTVYTFTIREGIEFHNGDELTAEDVKFSLERYHTDEANTPSTSAMRDLLDTVTVLSPTEVEVRLTRPGVMFPYIVSGLMDPGALIVPKDYIEEVGVEEFAQAPIGSGPYEFVERELGSHITVQRVAGSHWAVGDVDFERVTFRPIAEESTRLGLLRAGDLDFTDVGLEPIADLEQAGFQTFTHHLQGILHVMFNIGRGPDGVLERPDEPLHDINLRRALSYAINREELAESLLFGLGWPSGNMWLGTAGEPNDPIPPAPYDLDMAREALAQTPYGPDGEPLELFIQVQPRDGWPQMLQMAEAVQGYWSEIGIDSTIVFRDFADFRAEFAAGELASPTVILLPYTGSLDWHTTMTTSFTCHGVLSAVCDPQVDELHAEWGQARTIEEYIERAGPVERALVDNFLVLPTVAADTYFIGNDRIPSDYQPGWSTRALNTRAMVADY